MQFSFTKLKKHFGFTIIQLVIAMVIFSTLSGIAFYGGSKYINQGRETDARETLLSYEAAIETALSYNKDKCVQGSNQVAAGNLTYSSHTPSYSADAEWLSKVVTIDLLNNYMSAGNELIKDSTEPNFTGESQCVDGWGTPYKVYINYEDKNAEAKKECEISVICAGRDKQIGTEDDMFLTTKYADGVISNAISEKTAFNFN